MYRKVLLTICAVLLLSFLALPAMAGNMQEGSMYVYTANHRTLHFRETPKAGDNIIAEIAYGTKVFVLDWSGSWARIKHNGMTGYVNVRYLVPERPSSDWREDNQPTQDEAETPRADETPTKKPADKVTQLKLPSRTAKPDKTALQPAVYDVTVVTTVPAGYVTLRSKASLESAPVTLKGVALRLPDGFRLTVLAENRDWIRVLDGATGAEGYILKSWVVVDLVEEEILDEEILDDEVPAEEAASVSDAL